MLWGYTVRTLWSRKSYVFPTACAVAFSVGAVTVMSAMVTGIETTLARSADDTMALVLSRGSLEEMFSVVSHEALADVKAAPGVAQAADGALASPELYVIFDMRRAGTDQFDSIKIRGVDPVAFEVHPVNGTANLRRGQPGFLVGSRLMGKYEGLGAGEPMTLGNSAWPVIGELQGKDTRFESEVWADRDALARALNRTDYSTVEVRLQSPQALEEFRTVVNRIPELEVRSEREQMALTMEGMQNYAWVMLVLGVLLGVGALVATVNALHALVTTRLGELATLLAIGYSRGQVILVLLQEAFLLAVVGGAAGLAAAFAFNGRELNYNELFLVYRAEVSPKVVLIAIAATFATGLLAGMISAWEARKVDILRQMRAG